MIFGVAKLIALCFMFDQCLLIEVHYNASSQVLLLNIYKQTDKLLKLQIFIFKLLEEPF